MTVKNKIIFISGGAGFIGTHLTQRLASNNKIIIYDNFHRDALSKSSIFSHKNVEIINGDILDLELLKKSLPKADYIIHLAAIAGIDSVVKDPVKTIEINAIGTYYMLEAAKRLKCLKRFLYFSTSEVFGSKAYQVTEDDDAVLGKVGEPRWVYATGKFFSEHMIAAYAKKYKMPYSIIRPFNVYGPQQVGEGAVQVFIKKALRDENIKIIGDGGQIRTWTYIDDLLEGVFLCLTKKTSKNQVFNIANAQSQITILNLAKKIISLTRSKSKTIHLPQKEVDVYLRVPKIDKAIKLLGFKPKVDLEDGLARTIKWFRKNAKQFV